MECLRFSGCSSRFTVQSWPYIVPAVVAFDRSNNNVRRGGNGCQQPLHMSVDRISKLTFYSEIQKAKSDKEALQRQSEVQSNQRWTRSEILRSRRNRSNHVTSDWCVPKVFVVLSKRWDKTTENRNTFSHCRTPINIFIIIVVTTRLPPYIYSDCSSGSDWIGLVSHTLTVKLIGLRRRENLITSGTVRFISSANYLQNDWMHSRTHFQIINDFGIIV